MRARHRHGSEKRRFDLRVGGEWRRGLSGLEEERRMEVGAVKEVGQRREVGDRLTSGGNPTRPPELHRSGTAKNKTREASSADKTTYTKALHTQVVVQ